MTVRIIHARGGASAQVPITPPGAERLAAFQREADGIIARAEEDRKRQWALVGGITDLAMRESAARALRRWW